MSLEWYIWRKKNGFGSIFRWLEQLWRTNWFLWKRLPTTIRRKLCAISRSVNLIDEMQLLIRIFIYIALDWIFWAIKLLTYRLWRENMLFWCLLKYFCILHEYFIVPDGALQFRWIKERKWVIDLLKWAWNHTLFYEGHVCHLENSHSWFRAIFGIGSEGRAQLAYRSVRAIIMVNTLYDISSHNISIFVSIRNCFRG